jgi:hypothetical protein
MFIMPPAQIIDVAMNPTLSPSSTPTGNDQPLTIIKVFRAVTWVMFLVGLVWLVKSAYAVIVDDAPFYLSSGETGIGRKITDTKTKILLELGFIAGWIFVFTLILRFTSTKPRTERQLADSLIFDNAGNGRWSVVIVCTVITAFIAAFIYYTFQMDALFTAWGIALIVGAAFFVFITLRVLFRIDRIRLEFSTHSYRHDRGMAWRSKTITGTFDDFECVRLANREHSGVDGHKWTSWNVDIIWTDLDKEPLEVDQRPRGLNDLNPPPGVTSMRQATELAEKMNLPLRDETKKTIEGR